MLVIGGPPYQPFSSLRTKPKGFDEERSAPIKHSARIKENACRISDCESIEHFPAGRATAGLAVVRRTGKAWPQA